MKLNKWYGISALLVLVIAIASLTGCAYVDDAKDTAFQETKASTLLKKYETFKDLSASLDAAKANLGVLKGKIANMDKAYAGVPRNQWARVDADSYNQWLNEFDDQKLNYNSGAASYNSLMSKANYAFTNVGDLPKGATEVLPREFKPYIEQ